MLTTGRARFFFGWWYFARVSGGVSAG